MKIKIPHFGFRSSILAFCIGLTTIITIAISLISYNAAERTIENNTVNYINGNIEQVAKRFEMFTDSINRITISVSFDFGRKIATNASNITYEQQRSFMDTVSHFTALSTLNKYIVRMNICNFRKKEVLSVSSLRKVNPASDPEFTKLYSLFQDHVSKLDIIILPSRYVSIDNMSQNVITFVFPITDSNNSIFGCTATYVPVDYFNKFCVELAKSTRGYAALLDSSGQVLASSGHGSMWNKAEFQQLRKKAKSGKMQVDDETMIYGYYTTAWRSSSFLCLVPHNTIMFENTKALRENILISSMSVLVMAIITVYLINTSLFRPINRMLKQLQSNKDITPKSGMKDEIGYMLDRLAESMAQNQRLIRTSYEQELHLKDARIRLLVSQMNPHFLYNSLDNIIWLLEYKKYGTIKKMVYNLVKFYRASTDKGGEWVTIRQEKIQLESYISIQSIRFSDRLHTDIRFDEAVLDCMILKYILQPLVENAIIHGIEKKDGIGIISVSCTQTDQSLIIKVRDNGVGISQERMIELRNRLDDPNPDEKVFYAMHNINWRLKLHYGEEYGLQIDSVFGEGTCVTIRLPVSADEKERMDESDS